MKSGRTFRPADCRSPNRRARPAFTGGEVWELTFRQPGSKPLEIQATRSSALSGDTALSLAELAQASEQQGSVAIWATGRRIPQINNRRLTPIPINPATTDSSSRPADAPSRSATKLAAYQYDPVEEIISANVDPTASLTVSPGTERPVAWVWSCRLDSYYSPDGSSQHLGCWRIENTGRTRIRFQMPAGATFHTAWIDDVSPHRRHYVAQRHRVVKASVDPSVADGKHASGGGSQTLTNTAIKLELPSGHRFVRVLLQWSSGDRPLSILSSAKHRKSARDRHARVDSAMARLACRRFPTGQSRCC